MLTQRRKAEKRITVSVDNEHNHADRTREDL